MKYELDLGDGEFAGKMAIETLSVAQSGISALMRSGIVSAGASMEYHMASLQHMIDQLEDQRPDHQTTLRFCGSDDRHPSHPWSKNLWGWKYQCMGVTTDKDTTE